MTKYVLTDPNGDTTHNLDLFEAINQIMTDDGQEWELRAPVQTDKYPCFCVWTRKQCANRRWGATSIFSLADDEKTAEKDIWNDVLINYRNGFTVQIETQFIEDKSQNFDEFTKAYVEAILFTEADLLIGASITDFSTKAIEKVTLDCLSFLDQCEDLNLQLDDDGQGGHDFWLTRNGHGAGFWDRGLGSKGDQLTQLCETFGPLDVYIGDDGKVYL